ncbi:hypothetical protein CBL_01997 [Carabus blaptoides fortunei]
MTSNISSYSSNPSMSRDRTFLKNRSINMLSVTISTIMLMASKTPNISNEYYSWTDRYLKCIKDGHGNYPPNVERILKKIENLNAKEEEDDECKCSEIIPPFGIPGKI